MTRCYRVCESCLLVLVAVALISCTNESTPTDPVPQGLPALGPVLTPQGGAKTVENTSGARVTVSIPAGAVLQDIPLIIEAVDPGPGKLVGVKISPAGLRLLEPLTISVVLPDGAAIPASPKLYFGPETNPIYIATAFEDRTLTATLSLFGIPDANPVPGLKDGADEEVILSLGDPTCVQIVAAGDAAIARMVATPDYHSAAAVVEQYFVILDDANCLDQQQEWVSRVLEVACAAYANLEDEIDILAVGSWGTYSSLVSELMHWMAMIQEFSSEEDCTANYLNLLDALNDEFIEFYLENFGHPGNTTPQDYEEYRKEVIRLLDIQGQIGNLGARDAGASIRERLIDPVLTELRKTAFNLCGTEGEQYYLIKLHPAQFFYSDEDLALIPHTTQLVEQGDLYDSEEILNDIQQCGTSASVKSFDDQDVLVDEGSWGAEGPGNADDHVAVKIPIDGRIELAGDILAITCPPQGDAGDQVFFELFHPGQGEWQLIQEIEKDSEGAFQLAGIGTSTEDLFAAIGSEAYEEHTFDLRVRRQRQSCPDAVFGVAPNSHTLCEIEATVGEVGIKVEMTISQVRLNSYYRLEIFRQLVGSPPNPYQFKEDSLNVWLGNAGISDGISYEYHPAEAAELYGVNYDVAAPMTVDATITKSGESTFFQFSASGSVKAALQGELDFESGHDVGVVRLDVMSNVYVLVEIAVTGGYADVVVSPKNCNNGYFEIEGLPGDDECGNYEPSYSRWLAPEANQLHIQAGSRSTFDCGETTCFNGPYERVCCGESVISHDEEFDYRFDLDLVVTPRDK